MASRDLVGHAYRSAAAIGVLGLPVAWLIGGVPSAVGLAVGTATSCGSLWVSSRVVRGLMRPGAPRTPAIALLLLVQAAKLPLIGLAIFFANRLGTASIYWFLGGLLLVYLALVVGAVALGSAPANCE
ncbi:MAG: hypothetical protein IH851_02360 [Armatimonadetes bacterium]|nr:hypothetical protein [Armatimonadota bacterium]